MGKKIKVVEQEGYRVTVKGRHVEVTEAMKDYAIEKVQKVDRFTDKVIEATVTMDIVKVQHTVSMVLKAGHTKIAVSAHSDNMYASVDKAADRLQAKLRKYKDRLQEHQTKSLAAVDMNVNVLHRPYDELGELNDEIDEQNRRALEKKYGPHEIVRTEKRPLKTLTVSEATMKMELSGDQFLLFRAEEDRKLRVIYRTSDQNYGLLEPEAE
jgi:putative sigma-54 modulation protein